jgi:hypothetical protein
MNTDQVIVRIGVAHLSKLIQNGCGTIEAIQIYSDCLDIISTGSGNIYMNGRINLRKVSNTNTGTVTVLNANTPSLSITTGGMGTVNVSGRVGVQSIVHHGGGDINIIGADTPDLNIQSDGAGKIGIQGQRVQLRSINAKDKACVYINGVNSQSVDVTLAGGARIGLAGVTQDLHVTTTDGAMFFGRTLCSQNAYIRTYRSSHVNFTAVTRAFVSANDSSSVYFFGWTKILSSFIANDATVIPLAPTIDCSCYYVERPRMSYKGEG